MPTEDELKDVVINMLGYMNGEDLDFIDDLLADEYRFNRKFSTKIDNKKWLDGLRYRHPERKFGHDYLIAEDNIVAMQWHLWVPRYQSYGEGYFRGTVLITFNNKKRIVAIEQDDLSGRHHFLPKFGGGVIDVPPHGV